ncbi:hypothetical protein SLA2020_335200 [Shorea laevis]
MEETLEFASIKSGQNVLVASLQQYPPYQGEPKKERYCNGFLMYFCQTESETSLHVLWNCPAARDVWGSCDKRMQKSTSGGDSILEIMEGWIDRYTEDELTLYAVVARNLWFHRNTVVHGGVFTPLLTLVQNAVLAWNDYVKPIQRMK